MTLERLTQITSVGISSGITLSSATLTGVTTLTTLSAGGDIDAVNGTFSGNVSIAGTLTYEDVTNIDSVGLITARSGIHVTGGSVGIGTDNPQYKLEVQGATTPAITVRNTTTSSYSRLSAGEIGDGEIFAFQRLGSTSSASGGPKAGQIWNYADAPIVMGIGSTVRQKIQGDGKIVVGGNANQTANRNLSVVAESGNSNNTEIGLQPTNSSGGYNPEVIIGTTADGTYGAHMFFTTRDTGGTRTERIRITSNGLVGIGLTNPEEKLDINGGGIYLKNQSENQGVIFRTPRPDFANVQQSGGRGMVDAQVDVAASTTVSIARSHWGGISLVGFGGGGFQGYRLVAFGYNNTPTVLYSANWQGSLSTTFTVSGYELRVSHNSGNTIPFWNILIGV